MQNSLVSWNIPLYALEGLVISAFLVWLKALLQPKVKHPPGPKGSWFVGHTFQIPKVQTWKYFEKLGHIYGPIVKLRLAGNDIVILNRGEDAEELLGKRSKNYSSRKQLVYAGKYLSRNNRLVLMPYGELFKKQRQAFYEMLQPRVVGSYETMQLQESAKLLYDMLTSSPGTTYVNVQRFTACLVFRLSYGKRLSPDDADLKGVLNVLQNFVDDCYPGRHLVDTFPILDSQLIPNFLAFWRSEASKKHQNEAQFYLRLLSDVKDRMEKGEAALECFAARLWDNKGKHKLKEETMAYMTGVAFEAEVAKKAQAEIDAVLGNNGPPTYEHMKKLPYCFALCKEVFRWFPAAPGGFPHLSDKSDIYKGYAIRSNTMVIPNIWAIHHNEEDYSNPAVFEPQRFLNKQNPELVTDSLIDGHYGFGFGRRVCPGVHMGSKTVWIAVVQLLWGFDIGYARDEHDKIIPISLDAVTSGISIEPKPFKFAMNPRSEKHAKRIRDLWSDYEASFSAELQSTL